MSELSNKQKRMFKLARLFDKACRDINVKYSLACGTLLGCVRENGFIPWDEDFDVFMSIDEYSKLDKHDKSQYGFKWVAYSNDKNSPIVYARIYEENVDFNILEQYPYIDIHIYVPAANKQSRIKNDIRIVDFWTKCFWVKQRKYHNIFKRKKSFIGSICKIPLIFFSPKWIADRIIKYEKSYKKSNTKVYMPVQGYYKMKEVIPKEWLTKYTYHSFEDYEFMIIEEYDLYLRHLYGNYEIPVKYNH